MKLYNFLNLVILLNFGILNAQNDHLEPINETFNSNSGYLKNSLFKDLSEFPRFRVSVFPSFDSKYVLSLEENKENGKNYLIYQKMVENNFIPEKTDIYRRSKEISNETNDLIFDLFFKAISKTRYGKLEMPGNDGTVYVFSINEIQSRSGQTWSPEYNSKIGKLTSIINEIINIINNNNGDKLILDVDLIKRIEKLTSELKK